MWPSSHRNGALLRRERDRERFTAGSHVRTRGHLQARRSPHRKPTPGTPGPRTSRTQNQEKETSRCSSSPRHSLPRPTRQKGRNLLPAHHRPDRGGPRPEQRLCKVTFCKEPQTHVLQRHEARGEGGRGWHRRHRVAMVTEAGSHHSRCWGGGRARDAERCQRPRLQTDLAELYFGGEAERGNRYLEHGMAAQRPQPAPTGRGSKNLLIKWRKSKTRGEACVARPWLFNKHIIMSRGQRVLVFVACSVRDQPVTPLEPGSFVAY